MGRIKLDLHDIFSNGRVIEAELNRRLKSSTAALKKTIKISAGYLCISDIRETETLPLKEGDMFEKWKERVILCAARPLYKFWIKK